jgi:glycerophosphoryl diester phosphodiesterase
MPGRVVLPRPRSGGPFLVAAHRGNRIHCPENSLAGFRRAIEEGADLLETDLRPTSDGAFVCFHDRTLERTTNGRGMVERQSLGELTACSLRMGDVAWPHEHIPSLDALAALCPEDVFLALELKSHRFAEATMCSALVRELERLGMRKRVVVLSFHARHLDVLRSVAPEIPCGIVSFTPWPHGPHDLLGPVLPLLFLNPAFVCAAHRRGQVVCPLDSQPESRLPYYRRLGVDAVLSDDPGRTVAAALRLR